MYVLYYSSPLGVMKLISDDHVITELQFVLKEEKSESNALLREAENQITNYFAGKRQKFNLPLLQIGTPFQQSVWKVLTEIPYGETTTYGAIARKIGNVKAVRAVGSANGRNKIPLLIPCHRVVGHDGKLVGFAYGIERKMFLLNHEKNNSKITGQLPLIG